MRNEVLRRRIVHKWNACGLLPAPTRVSNKVAKRIQASIRRRSGLRIGRRCVCRRIQPTNLIFNLILSYY